MQTVKTKPLTKTFLMITLLTLLSTSYAGPKVGDKAPNFTLQDQHLDYHSLSDYIGDWVVLYFYPKDDTPGCTTQACGIRDAQKRIIATKAVIFGISLDSIESHQLFAEKYQLPFSILSDIDGLVSESYDSLRNLFFIKVSKRNTFIVDPYGKIAKSYTSVDPKMHTQMILDDLISLQSQ
jgi:peroxiredoxin Q/BCP